jgi:hypothetical protein
VLSLKWNGVGVLAMDMRLDEGVALLNAHKDSHMGPSSRTLSQRTRIRISNLHLALSPSKEWGIEECSDSEHRQAKGMCL